MGEEEETSAVLVGGSGSPLAWQAAAAVGDFADEYVVVDEPQPDRPGAVQDRVGDHLAHHQLRRHLEFAQIPYVQLASCKGACVTHVGGLDGGDVPGGRSARADHLGAGQQKSHVVRLAAGRQCAYSL